MNAQQWYDFVSSDKYQKASLSPSLEDIVLWPTGDSCFREDLNSYYFESKAGQEPDYVYIYFDSEEYEQAAVDLGYC